MDHKTADRLQNLRKERGYSQEQLAEELGVSRQAVSKWERGESSPDTDNLIALATLYRVSLDELIFASGKTEKQNSPAKENTAENSSEAEKGSALYDIIGGVFVLSVCIVYLVLGFTLQLWHPAWILFWLIPVVHSSLEAVEKRNADLFAYPVLITAIYLLLGCAWGLWHPWWIVFVTIPIYYAIIRLFKRQK